MSKKDKISLAFDAFEKLLGVLKSTNFFEQYNKPSILLSSDDASFLVAVEKVIGQVNSLFEIYHKKNFSSMMLGVKYKDVDSGYSFFIDHFKLFYALETSCDNILKQYEKAKEDPLSLRSLFESDAGVDFKRAVKELSSPFYAYQLDKYLKQAELI